MIFDPYTNWLLGEPTQLDWVFQVRPRNLVEHLKRSAMGWAFAKSCLFEHKKSYITLPLAEAEKRDLNRAYDIWGVNDVYAVLCPDLPVAG